MSKKSEVINVKLPSIPRMCPRLLNKPVRGCQDVQPNLSLSGRIVMARDWVERFTLGVAAAPSFSAAYTARRISTALERGDIVLIEQLRWQVTELKNWVRHVLGQAHHV